MKVIIPVLMYHSVEKESDDYLTVSCRMFEEQLAYLKEYHSILTARQILELISNGKEIPQNPVVITFDDSLRDNVENALPILDKYSAKATFFAIAEYIGKDTLWNHKAHKILMHMNEAELKCVHSEGHEIGNHTLTHQRVTKLSDEQLKRELHESNRILTEIVGQKPVTMAYPYGGVDQRCADIARPIFKACFSTVTAGYFNWMDDMAQIRRIYVSPEDDKNQLKYKISCYLREKQHE